MGMFIKDNFHLASPGTYLITNLQPDVITKEGKKFVTVGRWDGALRKLIIHDKSNITWNGWTKQVPTSICSWPCKPGHYGVAGKTKCCWLCAMCPPGYVKTSYGQESCTKCLEGRISNNNKTKCLKVSQIHLKWEDKQSILMLSLCSVGVLVIFSTLAKFVQLRRTPLIKASNKELSLLMLFTLFLGFLLPLLYIGKPIHIICKIQPIAFGTIYTTTTAILVMRTYRYLCIFNAKIHQSTKKLQSVQSQFLGVFAFTLAPILLSITWFLFFNNETHLIRDTLEYKTEFDEQPVLYLGCTNWPQYLHLPLLSYIAFLSGICCVLAFRTRKLPEVFSDAKWLAMTVFTLTMLWFPVIVLYYSQVRLRTSVMCWTIIFSNFITWGFTFLPKLKIILLHPEKNRKDLVQREVFNVTLKSFRYPLPTPQIMVNNQRLSVFPSPVALENNHDCDSSVSNSSMDYSSDDSPYSKSNRGFQM